MSPFPSSWSATCRRRRAEAADCLVWAREVRRCLGRLPTEQEVLWIQRSQVQEEPPQQQAWRRWLHWLADGGTGPPPASSTDGPSGGRLGCQVGARTGAAAAAGALDRWALGDNLGCWPPGRLGW
jgi:hypothetical protein